MTNDRAKEVLKAWNLNHSDEFTAHEFDEAFRMAIKALEQQPCEDAISRAEALKAINKMDIPEDMSVFEIKSHIGVEIGTLPPVQPKPKTGHWISCSERLPEICEKDCHGNITFSKTVLTTQIYGNGFVYVGNDQYTTNNGGWLSEVPFDNPDERCKVIAWMPLPEPYKPQESEDEE